MIRQTVAETMNQCCRSRPVLRPLLEAFEPLYSQRQAIAARLAPLLSEAGHVPGVLPGEQPVLLANPPAGLGRFIKDAARELLPLLDLQEAIVPYKKELDELFLAHGDESVLDELVGALLFPAPDNLISLAGRHGLKPEVLEFVSGFVVSAVLRGVALFWEGEEFPDWRRGKCPVCGMPPILAWLGRRPPAENNEFLRDGGGRKHLHCGMCGTDWHVMRGVCPACGAQGQDAMQILGEEDKRHERIDWCKNCHTYLPQIDLREFADTPDMDAMALGLMHLDMVAAGHELMPLKPSFWNMF